MNKSNRANSKRNYKGKGKAQTKSRGKDYESEESDESKPRTRGYRKRDDAGYRGGNNDVSWYAATPQLISDFASFPMGVAIGNKLNTGIPDVDQNAVAGIMSLGFYPTIGYANQENSPINVAMRQVFGYVRKNNSGATNYEAPDLTKYLVAVDSCYTFLSYMRRIYGLMMDYSYVNRYWPKAIIESMGVSYSDLQSQIANLRGFINLYAAKLGSLAIPATMPYMLRHTWLCSGVYMDANTEKGQLYYFTPLGLYQYEEGTDATVGGSKLSILNLPAYPFYANTTKVVITQPGTATLDDLIDYGYALLNPIMQSQAMNTMSGDILKAFQGNIVIPVGVSDDYRVLPEYNEEVLTQIMNATVVTGVSAASLEITENVGINAGYLVSTPQADVYDFITNGIDSAPTTANLNQVKSFVNQAVDSGMLSAYSANRYITFNKGDIGPADIMVATRLTNIMQGNTVSTNIYTDTFGKQHGHGYVTMEITTVGSEVIALAESWKYVYRDDGSVVLVSTPYGVALLDTDNVNSITSKNMLTNIQSRISKIVELAQFDWHFPVIPTSVYYTTNTNQTGVINLPQTGSDGPVVDVADAILQDIGNYTVLTKVNLENLAHVALLSEFYVPTVGTMSIGLS